MIVQHQQRAGSKQGLRSSPRLRRAATHTASTAWGPAFPLGRPWAEGWAQYSGDEGLGLSLSMYIRSSALCNVHSQVESPEPRAWGSCQAKPRAKKTDSRLVGEQKLAVNSRQGARRPWRLQTAALPFIPPSHCPKHLLCSRPTAGHWQHGAEQGCLLASKAQQASQTETDPSTR